MNLRRQLLLVSLLLLSLPWAGCQFIGEMESALRQGQEQSLQATAGAIAAVLGERPELVYPVDGRRVDRPDDRRVIYAVPIDRPLILDGYADGWEEVPVSRLQNPSPDSALAVSYQAVTRGEHLYLLLRVRDPDLVYENPGLSQEPNGDRVLLKTWQNGRRQEYVIATAAPGAVRARPASRREQGVEPDRIRGYWQDATDGYTLELEIPLTYTGGRLGFYVLDTASREGPRVETLGNVTSLENAAPPWLIYTPQALQRTLAAFRNAGAQLQVIDRHRWRVADVDSPADRSAGDSDTFWLLQLLYRSILSEDEELAAPPAAPVTGQATGAEVDAALMGNAANQRYRDPRATGRTLLSAAAPIRHDGNVIGAVLVRQSAEQYLSLTDRAFSGLLGYSFLALGIGTVGLLAYASLLSWRIGQLSRSAREAVADDGSIADDFPRSRAPDEIGDLSRHYGELLDKLRDHNDYLRTLSRKLSHELRTPIALIQTSLEHLEQLGLEAGQRQTYLRRAREGLDRLGRILAAMSEASRLEESLRNNPLEEIDLVPLLEEVSAGYRELYRGHRVTLACEPRVAPARAAADLLVQALDKLMENAATFTPPGEEIGLGLEAAGGHWAISVANSGPPLPDTVRTRLFEPMVSLRNEGSNEVHLGLGLHIVQLIARYHSGEALAENLPDGGGARFILRLPRPEKEEAPGGPHSVR